MSKEMTKGKLLEKIHMERDRFEETVVKLTKDQILDPGLAGGWSVKDILAHISVWEFRMIEWLEQALKGEVPELLAPDRTWDDLDEMNKQSYSENQSKSLSLILSQFHASFPKAIQAVEETPETALIDLNRFEWRDGNPLWKIVATITFWHYKEHGEQITAWLKNNSA